MSGARTGNRQAPRRAAGFTLLRPVPGDTILHRLWAGTKLLGLAGVALVLSFQPTWAAIGMVGTVVFAGLLLARIPRGAVPRLPRLFWGAFGLTAVLSVRSTARPLGHLAGVQVSWGGVEIWARLTALTVVVLAAAALVSWTTALAEVAPALSRLGTPFKWLRLPVDEWATTVALSIRCLPMLVDEVRTMTAARRLRPNTRRPRESRLNWWTREGHDLLMVALSVSLRRATELGDAIEARGGFGPVAGTGATPGRWDAVTLALVAGVCVAAVLV